MPRPAQDLLDRYLTGLASQAELAALARQIRQEPAFAEEFAHACRLDAGLFERFRTARMAADIKAILLPPPKMQAGTRPVRGRPRSRMLAFGAVAAGIVVAAVVTAILWQRHSQPTPAVAGELVSGTVLVDNVPARQVAVGAEIRAAKDAPAVVRLGDGSETRLQPGAVAVFRGSAGGVRQQVELRDGAAHFEVSQKPGVFEVTTPLARVRALGTAFSVALLAQAPRERQTPTTATKHAALSVAVTSGAVQVSFAGKDYRLDSGQECVFAADGVIRHGQGQAVDRHEVQPGLRLPEPTARMDRVVGFTDEQKQKIVELNKAREAAARQVEADFRAKIIDSMTPEQKAKWDATSKEAERPKAGE